jgi:hypothetical protein
MVLEYKTLTFINARIGLEEKDETITNLSQQGWRIVNESITPGHMKGKQACCLASLCLPTGFLAGRTPGSIVVSLVRDSTESPANNIVAKVASNRAAERTVGAKIGYTLGRLTRKFRKWITRPS